MPIRFPCTACGQLLGIATRKVGTEIHCPTCGLAVIVPDEAQAKLLRQRARGELQSAATPDTPPEISLPRERQEAFDGGLESFLTQLDVTSAAVKPQAANTSANVKSLPPAPPPVNAKSTAAAAPKNGSHATPAIPARPAVPPAATPQVPATKKQSPPAAIKVEMPLVFEDHEASVLSAADLLEVAEEPPTRPTPPPLAKAPAKPPAIAEAKAPTTAPLRELPAPPAAKQPALPPPAPKPMPLVAPLAEIAPLVAPKSAAAPDFGFDFSSPMPVPVMARPTEPALATAVAASSKPATVPTAPFDNAVWVSRRAIYTHVAILVLVSLATFMIGWISGGAGARIPGSSSGGPVRFEALIQYLAANGKTLPDEGAVVLLWPKQAKPLERLSIKRLAPYEPAPPADLPTLKALETLRGAYARTNAQGEIRDLLLTEPGEYYVLVISRNLARPPMEPISDNVIPILGDLFGGEAATLLGTRQFTLKSVMIADTRTLNHTFGAPTEK